MPNFNNCSNNPRKNEANQQLSGIFFVVVLRPCRLFINNTTIALETKHLTRPEVNIGTGATS